MNTAPHDFSEVSPARLAGLMDLRLDAARPWVAAELGDILHHQLHAAVAVDLAALDPTLAPKLRELAVARGLVLSSFGDLLRHPQPPLELLGLVKEFAKANRHHPRSPLPAEVATVLYYAAIAAALVACGTRITRLSDARLCEGWHWVQAQPWIDPDTAGLCARAAAALPPGAG